MLLTGIMIVSMHGAVFASSTEEQIADVQAQKEAAQAELAQQQSNMASVSYTHLDVYKRQAFKVAWISVG